MDFFAIEDCCQKFVSGRILVPKKSELVGGLEHFVFFQKQLGSSSSQLTIFFRGVCLTTNQRKSEEQSTANLFRCHKHAKSSRRQCGCLVEYGTQDCHRMMQASRWFNYIFMGMSWEIWEFNHYKDL